MTILIMCQGEQRRLAQLGHPKQLLQVAGETILGRTARMVREQTTDTIVVVGGFEVHPAVTPYGGFGFELEKPGYCILDGIAGTQALWSGRVVVLLGDVVWSRAALGALLGDDRPLVFAGTPDVSSSLGEIFGMAFTDHIGLANLLRTAPCRAASRADGPNGRPRVFPRQQGGHLRRLLWHAMQQRQLLPVVRQHTWHPDLYLPITDWTDDIDTPADVARLHLLEAEISAERPHETIPERLVPPAPVTSSSD